MVIFDLLKISDSGKEMYIELHVNKAEYFKNIYLESITIMTADQVSETDPLTPTANYIYQIEFDEGALKEYSEVLRPVDFNQNFTKSNLSSDLFFVYVKCKDAPIIGCPPCRLDELTTLGVTFDDSILHQKVLGYTKELADTCIIHQGFIDFILLWQAFNSAIETEHYIPAIKYWRMLFEERGVGSGGYIGNKGNCGCHGKNRI